MDVSDSKIYFSILDLVSKLLTGIYSATHFNLYSDSSHFKFNTTKMAVFILSCKSSPSSISSRHPDLSTYQQHRSNDWQSSSTLPLSLPSCWPTSPVNCASKGDLTSLHSFPLTATQSYHHLSAGLLHQSLDLIAPILNHSPYRNNGYVSKT